MNLRYIHDYYNALAEIKEHGFTNEEAVRPPFQACLGKYCKDHGLTLITEISHQAQGRRRKPDSTVFDSLNIPWGHHEAKDEHDDLQKEIARKRERGYPTKNIIFENTRTAVLIQDDEEILRVDMDNDKSLYHLIIRFLEYTPQPITDLRRAFEQFRKDLPGILDSLRKPIDESCESNDQFRGALDDFLESCRESINSDIDYTDIREMLIQHILTKDIFLKVLGDDQFHRENNIAVQLTRLEDTFFTGNIRRDTVDRLKTRYAGITRYAAAVDSYHEKQQFLKDVYQEFYNAYNPDAADRLGVIYTPNEIVEFIIGYADYLIDRHFGRHLYDKEVHILDPAVGTGTFITELIKRYIPPAHLEYKYKHEIHANEVSILPYYIANLNIEYIYKQRMKHYEEFPNICFMDTLDNIHYEESKEQQDWTHAVSMENLRRVNQQNQKSISVIIGNPPYNDSQQNWNDNNPNRKYPQVDKRIKDTYVKNSTSTGTHQYDMYKRFIRWASDRIGDNGVIAFITNRSYISSKQDDGFRKAVEDEFNAIYMLDLGGDIRAKTGGENVFGIRAGVAIGFFIKRQGDNGCKIYYTKRYDGSKEDKLAFLSSQVDNNFPDLHFEHITPDKKHNWINQTYNDFDKLICLANGATRLATTQWKEMSSPAVFKLYSQGASTMRDEWVYDNDVKNLRRKVKFFAGIYNEHMDRGDNSYDDIIKGSRGLDKHFKGGNKIIYDAKLIIDSMYRPFINRSFFASTVMNDELTGNHRKMFGEKLNKGKVICFSGPASSQPFQTLMISQIPSLDLLEKTKCLPLYQYDKDGNLHSNITDWGLQQFRDRYKSKNIAPEDIFHYIYAVLHHPLYREKYAINLTRDFPRVPFYDDFPQWAKWGKQLADLHIGFASQSPHPLKRKDSKTTPPGKPKLKAISQSGQITVDGKTTLSDIPPTAWQYRLGSRSALEWILDQYKEKKSRDTTIPEEFHTYHFADHKEHVIDLLARVCTVSVKTMEIIAQMPKSGSKK